MLEYLFVLLEYLLDSTCRVANGISRRSDNCINICSGIWLIGSLQDSLLYFFFFFLILNTEEYRKFMNEDIGLVGTSSGYWIIVKRRILWS